MVLMENEEKMKLYQTVSSLVPEAGLEPARAVKPEGF